jgi:hypothetical protein
MAVSSYFPERDLVVISVCRESLRSWVLGNLSDGDSWTNGTGNLGIWMRLKVPVPSDHKTLDHKTLTTKLFERGDLLSPYLPGIQNGRFME